MVDRKDWVWYGDALHFICGSHCRFHLATQIGDYLVSTVGALVPDSGTRRIQRQVRGWPLDLKGDEEERDYIKRMGGSGDDIGYKRKYETMVFKITSFHPCGCPEIDPESLDFAGYNEHQEARKGHMEMCLEWASRDELE